LRSSKGHSARIERETDEIEKLRVVPADRRPPPRKVTLARGGLRDTLLQVRLTPHFMRCKCGYNFSNEAAKPDKKFESLAVVRDRDYQAFLKSESRVLASKGEQAKMGAIAHSSELVGSLMECPQCSWTLFLKPGAPDLLFFRREDLA